MQTRPKIKVEVSDMVAAPVAWYFIAARNAA